MAVVGPTAGPTYGGIDFVSYEIPSFGTLYTAAGNIWHQTMQCFRSFDAPVVIQPDTTQERIIGILDNAPVGMETLGLPPYSTWEWFLFYTHPDLSVWSGHLADSDWIGAHGGAEARGTNTGLTLPPPWASTLPYGIMFYDSPTTMRFGLGAAPGPYAATVTSMTVGVQWFVKLNIPEEAPPPQEIVPVDPVIVPVNPPTPPPTNIVNPTTVPTNVQLRQQLQKANPGFTCDITRHEYRRDTVQVFLGQKIRVSVEAYGNKLGMVNRSNIVTQTRFRWRADGGGGPRKTFVSQFRLEAIPGTLLPGAGTSTAAQDAAGTGAEIGMFHELDTDGTGLDLGMLST